MALFSENEIADLCKLQKEERAEHFAAKYEFEINRELEFMEQFIRDSKVILLLNLKDHITHNRSAEASVDEILSFDFSKVGGMNTSFQTKTGENTTYLDYAWFRASSSSFLHDGSGFKMNRFSLWRSKDFLKRLATRLDLPDTMSFVIRSRIIDDGFKIFSDEVVEYITSLKLAIRF